MELKVMITVAMDAALPFQSHLYGIESKVGKSVRAEDGRFNRTFMELKVYFNDQVFNAGSCFNRTFMELKVVTLVSWLQPIGFQSHLYGIESWETRPLVYEHAKSFNRTFMELKGIYRYPLSPSTIVSIAPLWN